MNVIPDHSNRLDGDDENPGSGDSVAGAMDSPTSVERPHPPGSALTPAPASGPDAADSQGVEALGFRLRAIEGQLDDLNRRLDALANVIDDSVRRAVGDEIRSVSGELRHTVSELGRLLVKDLGRLAQILASHRDSILAELKRPEVPGADRPETSVVKHEAGDPAAVDTPAAEVKGGPEAERERRRRALRRRKEA